VLPSFRSGLLAAALALLAAFLPLSASAPPAACCCGDPVAATCRLEVPMGDGRWACGTATVVGPRRADGRWDVLTALHCFPQGRTRGRLTLPDGRSFGVKLTASDAGSDLAWAVTDRRSGFMPHAWLGEDAGAGSLVWHEGLGVDRPGNREHGAGLGAEKFGLAGGAMLKLKMNVSSGDSGSGLFDCRTGLLGGVVSCTLKPGSLTSVWAGPASAAKRCRPK
jgi:hypothetical protein